MSGVHSVPPLAAGHRSRPELGGRGAASSSSSFKSKSKSKSFKRPTSPPPGRSSSNMPQTAAAAPAGGTTATASWALPPLRPHEPHTRETKVVVTTRFAAKSKSSAGDADGAGLQQEDFLHTIRQPRGGSASPTRRSKRGSRRKSSRSSSPRRRRSSEHKRAKSAASRLTFRASAGRVQLSVHQPFFSKTQSKLERHRLKQRKRVMKIFRKQTAAARKIQRMIRARLAKDELVWRKANAIAILRQQQERQERQRIERARQEQREKSAILDIQRAARGRSARRQVHKLQEAERLKKEAEEQLERERQMEALRREMETMNAAASRVQALSRGRHARKKVKMVKLDLEKKREQHAAAVRLQAIARGRRSRAEVTQKKVAATKITSFGRAFFARKKTAEARHKKLEEAAATTITSFGRAFFARKQTATRRQEKIAQEASAQEASAALHLQRAGRGFLARKRSEKTMPEMRQAKEKLASEIKALEGAVARAKKNFDLDALMAFVEKARACGVSDKNEVMLDALQLHSELLQHQEAVIKVQRLVRSKLARLELQTLRMQVEAAVLLQGFMRMRLAGSAMAQKLQVRKDSAIRRLQRAVRGMITRKIFAEGMQILNDKLESAMEKLHNILNGPDGLALVRQHLYISNAHPTPEDAEKPHAPMARIRGLAQTLDILVTRDSEDARLGGGFDKLSGMSSTGYKGAVSRLTISNIAPGTPISMSELDLDDIVISIDSSTIESVQDLVGAVKGKKKMTFRVVRALREPTAKELLANVERIKDEFRRDSERRIIEVQKKGLVLELFSRPGTYGAGSASTSPSTSTFNSPRERVLSDVSEADFPVSLDRSGSFSGADELDLPPKSPTSGNRAKLINRWRKLKSLAWSIAGLKKNASTRVPLELSPGRGKKKVLQDANNGDVARNDLVISQLHNAVYDFDFDTIQDMLEHNEISPDLIESDDDTKYTLLLTCVSIAADDSDGNALDIARLLIERGADVNHVAADGSSPLILAAYQNDLPMIELLLELAQSRLHFAQTIQDGATALYLACQDGNAEVVRALLKAETCRETLTLRTGAGCTPLFIAVHLGFDDVVSAICEAVAQHDGSAAVSKLISSSALDTDLLCLAMQRCRFSVASMLMRYGAHIDTSQGEHDVAAENQTLQVSVCVGAPTKVLQELLFTAQAAIASLPDGGDDGGAGGAGGAGELHDRNLRAFALNAAKTAAFLLEVGHLEVLRESGLVDLSANVGPIFVDVHGTSLSGALTFFRIYGPHSGNSEEFQPSSSSSVDNAKRKFAHGVLTTEIDHLAANGHDYITAKELDTVLEKLGFEKHFGAHFREFTELLLFRVSSLCYISDPEHGLEDVGDDVEDDAIPLEGLRRGASYLSYLCSFFQDAGN